MWCKMCFNLQMHSWHTAWRKFLQRDEINIGSVSKASELPTHTAFLGIRLKECCLHRQYSWASQASLERPSNRCLPRRCFCYHLECKNVYCLLRQQLSESVLFSPKIYYIFSLIMSSLIMVQLQLIHNSNHHKWWLINWINKTIWFIKILTIRVHYEFIYLLFLDSVFNTKQIIKKQR